jgi:RNA polymerase sigma-70 factor (ECF subfamily)
MGQPSDLELVGRLNAGDGAAFDALYYRHKDYVHRLARRFTGHDDDALDVLQETFAYLARKFPGFRLTAQMTTFLYPVVRNLSLAAKRKRRRFVGGSDDELLNELPDTSAADPENGELVAILSLLPAGHREVLIMRFVDDFSLEEIATALSIPVGTVKSRLHHALAKLRTHPAALRFFEGG